MKKRFIALIILVILAMSGCDALDASGSDEPPLPTGDSTAGQALGKTHAADDVFTLNISSSQPLNPLTSDSTLNQMIAPLVYESLFTVDEHFEFAPTRLIESYESPDGAAWYFYIKRDIQFHDGSYVTPQDVSYSINRAMRGDLYSSRLRGAIGVAAYGDNLVIVNLYYANVQFPALLNIPIVPEGSLEEDAPPGTGPYMLSGSKLVINDAHPDAAKQPIDTIYLKDFKSAEEVISAFEDAQLDLVINDPTGLSDLGYGAANEVRYFNTTSMHYLGFNTESALFNNANTRAAMNYAVNRSQIVSNLMGGVGSTATLPISPVSPLYDASFAQNYEFSTEKCLKMFANANVKDHDDDGLLEFIVTGIPMEIDLRFIVNNESAVKVSAARMIAESMRELGITVTVVELGWSDFRSALSKGEYDMYYGEVMLSADFDLTSLLSKNGALNFGKYDDELCENLISEYLVADAETRADACRRLCQHIISNAPIVTIAFEKRELISHRGVVSGATPTQYNVFNKFENWVIDTSY